MRAPAFFYPSDLLAVCVHYRNKFIEQATYILGFGVEYGQTLVFFRSQTFYMKQWMVHRSHIANTEII